MNSLGESDGVFTTACPRNCYSTCSLKVEVRGGRLRRIEAHPLNRATPEGPCLKGLSYLERVTSPDRILHPLRRKQGSDTFERVDWETALDLITAKLTKAREEFGPQSVLYYSASGTKGLMNGVGMAFWRLFGGCTTTYGDLCWPAGLEAARLTLGENKHNAPWDIENARLILMWGKNAAETNVHQTVFVNRALQNGAKLVVIDPRRTETAERADLLVQPRPGTDGALALAVAHLLVRENWLDREFIERQVLGFTEFAQRVGEYTPDWAARICCIPEEQVRELARLIGTIAPLTINAGFGMQRYSNSGQTMRAMIALLALTGNIGKRGAGWIFADLQSHIFDAVKDPIAFYPPENPDGVVRVGISTASLGEEMLHCSDPPLRVAWVERGNPITQNPDTNKVREAFRALDFRVVVEQFMTDTAREADLILPAKTMFEQSDVINAYWHPYIQLKQKVLEAPGEVKPESEIYWHLARRLCIPASQLAGVIPAPDDESVEEYLRARLRPFPELSLEKLSEGPILAPGHQEIAFADGVFGTPSKKIELLSTEAQFRWKVDALPSYQEPVESIRTDEDDAKEFPLYFMTPNTKNRIHSQFNNLQTIRQFSPAPFLQMHPLDARKRGITEGSKVRVYNRRGNLELPVRFDAGLKEGCVCMTNGWWISEGGTVNFLSRGRETDMGHGAAFHENRVEVEASTRRG
ncbi:MAG TPA: molybdopterin-dependent oxidoreductase [Candidatus Krumholzibacteria bacterium]|nr:molybdopterin-dependent oxidoreductase [Candidatus Krumholzibacteria bacterium]